MQNDTKKILAKKNYNERNDIQYIDPWHLKIKQNDTRQNGMQQNDSLQNYTHQNNIQQNYTQHKPNDS
jgi:hypothetical protein